MTHTTLCSIYKRHFPPITSIIPKPRGACVV